MRIRTEGINVFRQEQRFFLFKHWEEVVLGTLKASGFVQRTYSSSDVTQTVYFLDKDQTFSLGVSFKARRYRTHFSDSISLDDLNEATFQFEEKRSLENSDNVKQKTPRIAASLPSILNIVQERTGKYARPYLVVEYQRKHFVVDGNDQDCRVTMDTDIRYWFFPPQESEAILLGEYDSTRELIRIEFKLNPTAVSTQLVQECISRLEPLVLQPIISKKEEGLNLIRRWHELHYSSQLVKELGESEIEAKITLDLTDPDLLFAELVEWLKKDPISITLDEKFPFILTSASINHYWTTQSSTGASEGVKVLFKGGNAKVVRKNHLQVVDALRGIIERKERKGDRLPYSGVNLDELVRTRYENSVGSLEYADFLKRTRKAIWVLSKEDRIYHLSLDRCTTKGRPALYQLEIEYVGRKDESAAEEATLDAIKKRVVADLQYLTDSVCQFLEKSSAKRMDLPAVEKYTWLTEGLPKYA